MQTDCAQPHDPLAATHLALAWLAGPHAGLVQHRQSYFISLQTCVSNCKKNKNEESFLKISADTRRSCFSSNFVVGWSFGDQTLIPSQQPQTGRSSGFGVGEGGGGAVR